MRLEDGRRRHEKTRNLARWARSGLMSFGPERVRCSSLTDCSQADSQAEQESSTCGLIHPTRRCCRISSSAPPPDSSAGSTPPRSVLATQSQVRRTHQKGNASVMRRSLIRVSCPGLKRGHVDKAPTMLARSAVLHIPSEGY